MGSRSRSAPAFSLVLGSGGTAGGAFHAGVLKALADVWQLDPRRAGIVVGTSAGSISATLLAAGLDADDLFRRETGKPLSPAGAERLAAARARIGPDRPDASAGLGLPAAPGILLRAALPPWRVPPGAVASALLPRGTASTGAIAGLVDGLLDRWPERPALKVVSAELRSGRRRVFDGSDGVSVGDAVAASCAVPGVFAPVEIDGVEHVDGAAVSSDNVDVLRRERPQEVVVVSSPMSAQRLTDRPGPWSAYRAAVRSRTALACRRLPGSPMIVVLAPGPDDLDAMGPDMLDTTRRPTVAMQAYATASDLFRSLSPTRRPHPEHRPPARGAHP